MAWPLVAFALIMYRQKDSTGSLASHFSFASADDQIDSI